MSPVDKNVIEAKRALILREVELLQSLHAQGVSNRSELALQHGLCHSVQILVSAAIDIAQHIVIEKSVAVPGSYAEAVMLLGQIGVLPPDFAREFSEVAKLRNVLVHAYEDLDIDRLAALIPRLVKDVGTFLSSIQSVSA